MSKSRIEYYREYEKSRRSRNKETVKEFNTKYRETHKAELKASKASYYKKNRSKILKKHQEYYQNKKVEFRARAVAYKFGISLDEYNLLVEKQHNLCAICGKPERSTRNGVIKSLAVDHNHETGKIRGLLCESCNTALGKVNDDVNLLQRMIEYIKADAILC